MNFPEMTEQQVKFFLFDCVISVASKLEIDIIDYNSSQDLLDELQEKIYKKSYKIGESLSNFREIYLKWFELINNKKQTLPHDEVINIIMLKETARQELIDICSKIEFKLF